MNELVDMDVPTLTRSGRTAFEARIKRLEREVIPQALAAMMNSEDDGRDAAEFERATIELHRLRGLLGRARTLEDGSPRARGTRRPVGLGDEVELRSPDGTVDRCLIVHPVEAPLDEHRVSAHSPLGKAVLGRRPGEVVEVQAPGRPWQLQLVRWDRGRTGGRVIAEVLEE